MSVGQYIDRYKNVAMQEMITFKIPASITLAQGLLESGSGNSRLAVNGNNHFGIKCKKDWTGCTILEDDDALQECFRCYTNAEESYKDHSRFLRDNKRYAGLFALEISDYKGWAAGLLDAGYATNRKYTELLINCIEKNKLAQYDSMVISGYDPNSQEMPANIDIVNTKNLPVTVIQPNQTLAEVADQHDKSEKKLARYNDLDHHHIEPGDVIYLKPKKRKAGVATHTVKEGEDMWVISQIYAIRLQSLYRKNRMNDGSEPVPGSVLQLQRKAENTPDTIPVNKNEINRKMESGVGNSSYHTVLQGETLYSISKLYGVTVEDIKELNKLNGNTLSVGQKLKITGKQVSGETPSLARSHIVKEGDTLYSVSRIYNVKVEDIKKWNNLASDSLSIGQILVIQ